MVSVQVVFHGVLLLIIILVSFLYFEGVFNKTIAQITIVGYEMIKANSALLVGNPSSHIQRALVE